MRFVCESCRAQYMINDEKVGPKGVKVRCRKCGYVIHVKKTDGAVTAKNGPVNASNDPDDATATQVMNSPLAAGTDATLDLTSPGAPAADPPTSRVNMNDPAVQAAMESKAAKTAAAKEKNGAEKNGEAKEASKADPKPGDSFLGADEDEIGAVFDSVLAGVGVAWAGVIRRWHVGLRVGTYLGLSGLTAGCFWLAGKLTCG